MAVALLPIIPLPLTPDQHWALKTMNTTSFATIVAILATGVSLVGFGFTDSHGLPPDKQGGKVKKVAHRFFTGTLVASGAAAVCSMGYLAYASYVFHKNGSLIFRNQ
jgi:hypothetical protein